MPFRDGFWIYRCNHRALRELEVSDGGQRDFLAIIVDPRNTLTHRQNFLWALSATHRQSAGVTMEEWLEALPTGDAWEELYGHAHRMVREFLPTPKPEPEPVEEDPEGNLRPTPSESAPTLQDGGDSDSTLPPS
jgi:hypothetical protein